MAEVLALGAAARLAVAAFSAVSAASAIKPELKALQVRVLAAAASVEAMGPAFEKDARAAPLVETLKEATAWIERREMKLEIQSWLHKTAMSNPTKAEIARLDGEISKRASRRASARAEHRARNTRCAQPTLLLFRPPDSPQHRRSASPRPSQPACPAPTVR